MMTINSGVPNFITNPPANNFVIDVSTEISLHNIERVVQETILLVRKGLEETGLLTEENKEGIAGLRFGFDPSLPSVAFMDLDQKIIFFNPDFWKVRFPKIPLTQLYLAVIFFHEMVHAIQYSLVGEKFFSGFDPNNQTLFGIHEDTSDYLCGCFYAFLELNGYTKKGDIRRVIGLNRLTKSPDEPDESLIEGLLKAEDMAGLRALRSVGGHASSLERVRNFRKGYFEARERGLKAAAEEKMRSYVRLTRDTAS